MNAILNTIVEKLSNKGIILQYKDGGDLVSGLDTKNTTVVASKIGDAILLELAYIKNKQQPVYQEYINTVTEYLSSSPNLSELAKYKVNSYTVSEEIKAFVAKGIIPSQPLDLNKPLDINIALPIPTDEELRLVFKYIADAELSIYAEKLYNKYTLDDIKQIYNKYISILSPVNENYMELNTNSVIDIDALLLAYIGISNLTKELPAKYSTMDLTTFKSAVSYYTTLLINRIVREVVAIDGRLQRRQLIISLDTPNTTVNVQAEVYNEFISGGGKVETLLGYIVNGKFDNALLTAIIANSPVYEKLWEDKVNILKLTGIEQDLTRYRVAYSISMGKVLNEILSDELQEQLPMAKNLILKETDAILRVLNNETLRNIGKTCQILIAKLIFPNSKFEYFTSDMIEASESIPDISPKDAASYASIKMLIRYLVHQLTEIRM